MSDIASVSLERPLEDIARDLGESFAEFGFGIVRDHGIPDELVARAQAASEAFFALPEEAKRAYGRMIPSSFSHKRLFTLRHPVGVCASVSPWNFPIILQARKLAPALAAALAICEL